MLAKPRYSARPIRSIKSLARALGSTPKTLRHLAAKADTMYIGPKLHPKRDGGVRKTYDTKSHLKSILKRINQVIFSRVWFPEYLVGSLPRRGTYEHASIHAGSQLVITEDIRQYFDHVTEDQVNEIWTELFNFSTEVAEILTRLTVLEGRLPQGSPTSSYLANLALWKYEPEFVRYLSRLRLRYSRYVDDICISATRILPAQEVTAVIAKLVSFLRSCGHTINRKKHKIMRSNSRIKIMGMVTNSKRPSIDRALRNNLRAAVFQATRPRLSYSDAHVHIRHRLGRIKRFHTKTYTVLRQRLDLPANTLKFVNEC